MHTRGNSCTPMHKGFKHPQPQSHPRVPTPPSPAAGCPLLPTPAPGGAPHLPELRDELVHHGLDLRGLGGEEDELLAAQVELQHVPGRGGHEEHVGIAGAGRGQGEAPAAPTPPREPCGAVLPARPYLYARSTRSCSPGTLVPFTSRSSLMPAWDTARICTPVPTLPCGAGWDGMGWVGLGWVGLATSDRARGCHRSALWLSPHRGGEET